MTQFRKAGVLASTAVALCAAKGDDPGSALLLGGLGIALSVALAMPAALLLHGLRPDWITAESRTFDRRKTACVLVGAGIAMGAILLLGAVASRNVPLAVLLAMPALVWFLVGFAGCALREGLRLVGSSSGTKPFVVGWLARAGAFAVPVLWPIVGAYLVATALGLPVVTMFDRDK